MVGVEKEETSIHALSSIRATPPWLQFESASHLAWRCGMRGCSSMTPLNRLLILAGLSTVCISQTSNTRGQTLAITLRGLALASTLKGQV